MELLFFLVILYLTSKLLLDYHQINFISNADVSRNEISRLGIDDAFVNQSNNYNIFKIKISAISTLVNSALIIFVLFLDGYSYLYNYSNLITISFINNELGVILIYFLISILINLPISYYQTFIIEENFGFNKMTKNLFIKDTLITSIFSLIIISILFKLFEILYVSANDLWWFYMWIIFILTNLIAAYVFPTIIAPLFNKFTKLDNPELIKTIDSLVAETKFPVNDLYVMDGSKRSAHSNAYFTGLFGKKRIVFFDTLLEMLSASELKSVLAHEIGHYKKRHIFKSLILFSFISLVFIFIFHLFVQTMFTEFDNLQSLTPSFIAILFIVISPLISFFLKPFLSSFSRKNEFEADNYAKEYSEKQHLISSLLKLYRGNLSLIKSSPLYSAFYYSHPSVFDRIENLEK